MSQALSCFCNRKFVLAMGLLLCCFAFAHERRLQHLEPLPPGVTLPVILDKTLDLKHFHQGEIIVASLYQRIPLAGGFYIPQGAKLLGTAVASDGKTLELTWTRIKLGHQSTSIAVKLLAAAHWTDVADTKLPLAGPDRATSNPADWTTMQIGRDEVYRSGGSGTVYNQYSEPVGKADLYGVYAAPKSPSAPPLAMGPFSTTSAGLYDMRSMAIGSAGGPGRPIVFRLEDDRWQLHAADALLLETVD